MPTDDTIKVLSDNDLREVGARAKKYKQLAKRAATPADEEVIRWLAKQINALCATVRVLRAELERTPLAQSVLRRLDELRAANQRATETNTALREQLAEAQVSLIAVRNCQNLHCGHCAALLRATLEKQL